MCCHSCLTRIFYTYIYIFFGQMVPSPLSRWVPLPSNEDNGRSPFNEKPAKCRCCSTIKSIGKSQSRVEREGGEMWDASTFLFCRSLKPAFAGDLRQTGIGFYGWPDHPCPSDSASFEFDFSQTPNPRADIFSACVAAPWQQIIPSHSLTLTDNDVDR